MDERLVHAPHQFPRVFSLLMREGQPPRRVTAPSVRPKAHGLDLCPTVLGSASAIDNRQARLSSSLDSSERLRNSSVTFSTGWPLNLSHDAVIGLCESAGDVIETYSKCIPEWGRKNLLWKLRVK